MVLKLNNLSRLQEFCASMSSKSLQLVGDFPFL